MEPETGTVEGCARVLLGLYRDHIQIMENQMENKMDNILENVENEMETLSPFKAVTLSYLGIVLSTVFTNYFGSYLTRLAALAVLQPDYLSNWVSLRSMAHAVEACVCLHAVVSIMYLSSC